MSLLLNYYACELSCMYMHDNSVAGARPCVPTFYDLIHNYLDSYMATSSLLIL